MHTIFSIRHGFSEPGTEIDLGEKNGNPLREKFKVKGNAHLKIWNSYAGKSTHAMAVRAPDPNH